MTRRETLMDAIKCVCGDREQDYGSPENNFQCCADLWNTYLGGCNITAHDVGIMMALLKIARVASGRYKDDTYVDAAGYIACAAEIAAEIEGAKHATESEQPTDCRGLEPTVYPADRQLISVPTGSDPS